MIFFRAHKILSQFMYRRTLASSFNNRDWKRENNTMIMQLTQSFIKIDKKTESSNQSMEGSKFVRQNSNSSFISNLKLSAASSNKYSTKNIYVNQHLHLRVQLIVSSILMSTIINDIKSQNSRLNLLLQQTQKRYFPQYNNFSFSKSNKIIQVRKKQVVSFKSKKVTESQQNEQIANFIQLQNDTLKNSYKLEKVKDKDKHNLNQNLKRL